MSFCGRKFWNRPSCLKKLLDVEPARDDFAAEPPDLDLELADALERDAPPAFGDELFFAVALLDEEALDRFDEELDLDPPFAARGLAPPDFVPVARDELDFDEVDLDEVDLEDVDLDDPALDADERDFEPEVDFFAVEPDFRELDPEVPVFLEPVFDEVDFLLEDFLVSGIIFSPALTLFERNKIRRWICNKHTSKNRAIW